jgi:hypothetical protein
MRALKLKASALAYAGEAGVGLGEGADGWALSACAHHVSDASIYRKISPD